MHRLGVGRHWLFVRARSFEPEALCDVEGSGGGLWQVKGPRPLVRLILADGGPALTGDVRLELQVSAVARPMNATLLVDTGGGLEAATLRVPLPARRGDAVTAVVTLPNDAVALGLDPGPVGQFQLGSLRAVELSGPRAVLAHAAPQLGRLLRQPGQVALLLVRALRLLRERGPTGVLERLRRGTQRQLAEEGYEGWVRRYATLSDAQSALLRARLQTLAVQPTFSILLAPGPGPGDQLGRTLESLRRQIYQRWEVCLPGPKVTEEVLQLTTRLAGAVAVRCARGADALEAAGGEWVVRLEAGDTLASQALLAVAEVLGREPTLALVYTDTDGEDEKGRLSPAFKPDWSPELLRSHNYLGRAAFLRRDMVQAKGGWHGGLPRAVAQHELLLRYTADLRPERVRHLPYVFLHTAPAGSPTSDEVAAGVGVAQANLERSHLTGRVEPGRRPGTYHVRYAIPRPPPLVSVVIPTRDRLALLQKCLKSLRNQTDYQPLEVLVVDNGSRQRQTKSYLEDLKRQGAARVLPFPQAFNYSAMNNLAAQEARGELLCLLNNDVQAIESGWLTEMVGLALQPGVGAVGAKLLYPNDTVQHAGMVGGLFGVVAHAYLREPREADGYLLQLQTTREVAAVTAACMVIRRDRFLQVGGLDKRDLPIGFNDVDLCFRLLKAGYRNLWTPYAELYHWESASRGTEQRGADRVRFLREESVLGQRWRALTERDPYYNPNLSLDSLVPRPAWPPRVVWPWMGER